MIACANQVYLLSVPKIYNLVAWKAANLREAVVLAPPQAAELQQIADFNLQALRAAGVAAGRHTDQTLHLQASLEQWEHQRQSVRSSRHGHKAGSAGADGGAASLGFDLTECVRSFRPLAAV